MEMSVVIWMINLFAILKNVNGYTSVFDISINCKDCIDISEGKWLQILVNSNWYYTSFEDKDLLFSTVSYRKFPFTSIYIIPLMI